jgi:hypothetical protein
VMREQGDGHHERCQQQPASNSFIHGMSRVNLVKCSLGVAQQGNRAIGLKLMKKTSNR